MTKRKVLITGASGYIASLVLPTLRERYDLTLLDVRTTDRRGDPVPGVQVCDLLDTNRDAYRAHFRGVDAVVHLGFTRAQDERDPDQRFAAEYANVRMAYNVYQVCWEEGVRRAVIASSNHAADYYEPLILDHKMDFVDPNGPARSDNFYGWSKQTYEHLGFVFAVGAIHGGVMTGVGAGGPGRPLENVQIRIGGPRETDLATITRGDMVRVRRALAAYLSARDLTQLIVKSIETADIRDENGVPFQIFYGVSGNTHAFWSIANARKIIGYAPEDNSEIKFSELFVEHVRAAQAQGKI